MWVPGVSPLSLVMAEICFIRKRHFKSFPEVAVLWALSPALPPR